jgi:hypothetical protein
MRDKKGVFFSSDAIIALAIILLVVIVAYPAFKSIHIGTKAHYDLLEVLSNLKTGEINNSYVKSLISAGQITDLNKSLLEQIVEFSITNPPLAKAMAASVLENINTRENIGIWAGNSLILSYNRTPYESAKDVELTRQTITGISGIPGTNSSTGFSARAYLTKTFQSKHFYFGGYIGDGNISQVIK